MRSVPRLRAPRILAALLLLSAVRLPAAEPVSVDGSGRSVLDGRLEILRDPGGRLDAAAAEALRDSFRPVRDTANLGVTTDTVWLRLALRNAGPVPRRAYVVFRYPMADSVVLSVLRAGGGVEEQRAGDSISASPSVAPSRHFAFPVDLGAGEKAVCLLAVRNAAGMSLPLAVVDERTLAAWNLRDSFLYGVPFGALIVALLYLLAARYGKRWAGWFCLYILAFGLHVASRGGYLLLLLGSEGWRISSLVQVAVLGMLFFAGAAFYRSFLDLRGLSRLLDGIMAVLQYAGLAMMPLFFFPNPVLVPLSALVSLVGPLFSVSLAAALWLRRIPNAGLFAAGWTVPHLVSAWDFLRIHAVLPYSLLGDWMFPAAFLAALLCLSWAVMRRGAREAALARTDGLTGLANRRRFDEALREEWSRSQRQGSPLALLMIDIDDFKRFNDMHGHRAGDRRLQEAAAVFARHARRAGDLAARYGGEEFAVILPHAALEEARLLAERILRAVRDSCRAPAGGVTVSIGAASRKADPGEGPERLVAEADRALYRAKEAGKDRVVAADGGPGSASRPDGGQERPDALPSRP